MREVKGRYRGKRRKREKERETVFGTKSMMRGLLAIGGWQLITDRAATAKQVFLLATISACCLTGWSSGDPSVAYL
jgi:hypothetical protein